MPPLPTGIETLPLYDDWAAAADLDSRCDPWSFSDRVSAYKLLIGVTNGNGIFGDDNAANPLWGLLFQLSWQRRTGRLNAVQPTDDAIDPDAPWAYGNFALNTIPLLGAIAAGAVPDLEIGEAGAPSRFRYAHGRADDRVVPPEFVPPVREWATYFTHVDRARPGDDLEPLLFAMWAAHKSSLDVVREQVSSIVSKQYSSTEVLFLAGWCRMVDYLWAAAWPTDFTFMVENGTGVLPERVLTDDDASDGLDDLPANVQSNVRNILQIATTPGWRFRINLALWRRAMRTRAARDDVVTMLDALFNPTAGNRAERRRLFRYMIGF